jgi:hypothetical protein
MAIVCRQCGRRSTDGSRFCANPECGAYLGWEGQEQPAEAPAPVLGGTPAQPFADTQSAAATLTLSDSVLSVVPGETATSTATVHNGGSQVEQFAVEVVGPTAGWAVIEPAALTVYPGERAQSTIRLSPPRTSATAAGRAWFTVRATSMLHPGLAVGANGTLEVGAFRELSASLSPQGTSGRWRTVHGLDLTNGGNIVEPVRLQAGDPSGRLRIGLPAGEIPLAPGTHRVNLAVRPAPRLVGRPQAYPFQVTVVPRPPTPPIRLDGRREGIPLVAGWVPKVVGLLAVLAAAAVVALVLVPRRGSTPAPAAQSSQKAPVDVRADGGLPSATAGGGGAASVAAPAAAGESPPVAAPPKASAKPPAAPGACRAGFVWRLAFDSDKVCVAPAVRDQAAADNAAAAGRWTSGAYGPDTCLPGYVWRDSSPTDHVCVTGDVRTQAAQDNAQATARLQVPPRQCLSGYVWREAFPTDYVCVTPATRGQAASDNAQATARRDPTGPYGVTTCVAGYVWREARPVDRVCVTADIRAQTAQDNSLAASHTA